jgi:YesN/AraC family two-component response regulator
MHQPKISNSIPLIFDWIENHFQEDFQLDMLAKEIHLSPNHVSYIFHKETGSSISDYLAARRLQEACSLLRTSSLNIQEVGYRVGFGNFSYFCKFFKKHIGMTPHQFRQNQLL